MNLYDLELDLNKKVANSINLFTNVDTYKGFLVHCVNDVDTLELYLQQKNNSYKVIGIKENNNFSFIFPLLKKGYVKFQFVGKKENEIIASNFFYSIVKDNIVSEFTNSRNVNLIELFDKISNNGELSEVKGDKGDTGQPGGFNIWVRFGLPDTSYNGTGTGTGSGIIAGIYNGATMATGATGIGTMNCACFRRIHNFGVLTHDNWTFVTNNATSSVGTEIDTGLPFVAGNMYLINISCVNGGAGITWYIKNENTGQSATGLATGTLPAINTMLGLYIMCNTINAVARKIGTQFLYCESDR